MTLRVVICEDEPLARETLREWVAARPQLALVGEAADGAQALAMIRALQPGLVFMDIQMPEMTGLEVVRRLDPLPALVFTTAYDQHAVTAFELHAVDYLLKPFSRARFDAAVERVLAHPLPASLARDAAQGALERGAGIALERILVRDRGQIFPLATDEIEYLRADAKYTLVAARGSHYLVRVALGDIESRLDARKFLRIHRSALVNLDFVVSMKPDEQSQLELRMRDGTVLTANRDASRLLRDLSI
ncbi:MAG: response regulator transcription factor [Betaproteobacteria bacterium]|nr:response regulator transcription factor [Betaproteobacteria bacterium]